MSETNSKNYAKPFALMVGVFFMFGFVTAINGIMQPALQNVFQLSDFKANLVTFSFFAGFVITSPISTKIIERLGYKKNLVIGLLVIAIGLFVFYINTLALPNVIETNGGMEFYYYIFLFATFLVGSGVTILQVGANPYVIALGDPETADSRMNLVGFFNSSATFIAPALLGGIIFSESIRAKMDGAIDGILSQSLKSEIVGVIQTPYLILVIATIIIAVAFSFMHLPKLDTESDTPVEGNPLGYSHMWQGVLAIFMYVGAEVTIGNNLMQLISSMQKEGEFTLMFAPSVFVSLYWGGAMIGRLAGAFIMKRVKTETGLIVTSISAIVLVISGVMADNQTAILIFTSIGLVNSVMWGAIFPLGIAKMGKLTNKASGYMLMGVFGGALIPLAIGYLADIMGSMHSAYGLITIMYAYLLYYALIGSKVKSQPAE